MHVVLFITSHTICDLAPSNNNLLLSRDVALTYGRTVHFGHLHVTLDLSEIQAEVFTTNSHKRAPLPRSPQGSDLLKFKSTLMI